ncbi:hypothetical protein EJ05DRAFT_476516 [Pseudovirgaria hyperparasitica]|uniref:rhomboid protease n=1 Tax=Pseudovirgaria hyperparasitica TaxID=470096 RepID=A0A6A6WAV9_9PEZI|nr:uncharacterized protein EJ05DRAFT_476516 [Pseudovirgaria hyperparasitica]KAF2758261.1 hypothetical protein EJ05DRAFT_476516 [Pseudovirgaria hyperparasitica]
MAFSLPQFNPIRIRSYVLRLPLATRLLLLVIVLFYLASWLFSWLQEWGALIPSKVGLATLYRLNTYVFLHVGFFHAFFNLLALTPLLERFESENGTIVTIVLFTGPFGLLPGAIYILLERGILRGDVGVQGSSILVFLLLASEAVKTYRANPHLSIGTYRIPTWTTPLFIVLAVSFIMPNVSLLGHLSGAAIGYAWGFGYLRFLAPPEKILRWIEGKLNLLGRLPHYVSVDQKTYGRYGVLPSSTENPRGAIRLSSPAQRLGP